MSRKQWEKIKETICIIATCVGFISAFIIPLAIYACMFPNG